MQLKFKLETGLEFGSVPGVISRFHERAACDKAGYRFYDDWQELSYDQRVETVAHYIAELLVESIKHDALQSKIQKDARKRKKGAK